VRQRNLYGIVLLLAALPVRGPAQSAEPAPAAWATSGSESAAGSPAAPPVIASSRQGKPPPPTEARLPLPDDGLHKPTFAPSATATARPPAGKPSPPANLADEAVRRAVYVGQPAPGLGRPDPGVVPASAATTGRETPRQPGEGSGSFSPVQETGHSPLSPVQETGSGLSLQVKGPATSAPGQTLSWTVVARNAGSVVLAAVRVELPLPEVVRVVSTEPAAEKATTGSGKLVWNLGNLEVGAERLLKLDASTNDAGELHLCPTASFAVAVGLRTSVVRPPFALSVSGPDDALVGGPVVWNLRVGNHTSTPLQRVTLTCKLSAGLSHQQGDNIEAEMTALAPGEVRPLKLEVQALKPGRQVISLAANADGGLSAQAQGVVKVNELALALAPRGPRRGGIGENLAYRLEVNNPGANPSNPIRLTQVLPEGLEFSSASPGGLYNPATQTITWALDGLPGRQRHEVSFQVRPRKMGDWALASAVTAEGMPEVRATHAVHVSAAPSLTLEVTAHDDPLGVGGETTCDVRVYNHGPASAEGVRLRLVLPDHLLAVQASAPTRWQIQGQQVLFDPIDQMRGRVAAVYRIRLRGVREGVGPCRAELTADGLGQPIQQELTCRVQRGPTPGKPPGRAPAR
jgi:uncharacterized repeat protein (TIGR01451 family)